MNGGSCTNLKLFSANTVDPSGSTVNGVRITLDATSQNIFLKLGRFLGCGSGCDSIKVSAGAIAAPGGFLDIVTNLDDTGSMSSGNPSWISQAKAGATTLVNALVPSGASSTLPSKVSIVPFRGCYNSGGSSGCIDNREYSAGDLVSLSTNNSTLRNSINAMSANGGSGSNNCDGLMQSRLKLFQATVSRSSAQKFLIVLTDAQSNYDDTNGSRNVNRQSNFNECQPSTSGNPSNTTLNQRINYMSYVMAQDIKNGTNVGTSGQPAGKKVEVYVILYNTTGTVAACAPPPTGQTLGTYAWNTTAKNLGVCMATDVGHVYLAPTPASIQTMFQAILSRLPVRLLS